MLLILLGSLVVIALIAAATVLARSSAKTYATQNELIPGMPTSAPASWAGAHSPEAKMHRRLGKALTSIRITEDVLGSGASASAARLIEMRVELEQQALQVDNQLIAAAAAPSGPSREARLAQLEQSVQAIETAAGDLGQLIAGSASMTHDGVSDVADQIRIAGEVQRELDALEGTPPDDTQDDIEGFGTPGTA